MSIKPAIPDNITEEDNLYVFRNLMDTLVMHKELIITIPSDELDKLRKGLIMRKSKDNSLLKKQKLMPDDEVLSFTTFPKLDEVSKQPVEGQICVRVHLGPRKSVTVLNIQVPDNEL